MQPGLAPGTDEQQRPYPKSGRGLSLRSAQGLTGMLEYIYRTYSHVRTTRQPPWLIFASSVHFMCTPL